MSTFSESSGSGNSSPDDWREWQALIEGAETEAQLDELARRLGISLDEEESANAAATAAAPAERWTVKTLGEVAEFFGVAVQTVKQWRSEAEPMPGVPGRWPLAQIARWKIGRIERTAQNAQDDTRRELERDKLRIETEIKRLRLEEEAGRLVPVDSVARLIARNIAVHNAQAEQLRERVLGLLPESLAGADKRRIVKGVEKAVADLRGAMADANAEWEREQRGEDLA